MIGLAVSKNLIVFTQSLNGREIRSRGGFISKHQNAKELANAIRLVEQCHIIVVTIGKNPPADVSAGGDENSATPVSVGPGNRADATESNTHPEIVGPGNRAVDSGDTQNDPDTHQVSRAAATEVNKTDSDGACDHRSVKKSITTAASPPRTNML